jgi:HK97 family phage portal protein
MAARALLARGLRTVARAIEGQYRPGPYNLPITGGWLPDGAPINWWQTGMIPVTGYRNAMVEACVSAYSQTTAMLPGDHWRTNTKGGRERVKNSALSRILRHPNAYQSISDFMLNATRQLYLDGNAYALALRNDRFEVTELHLMDSRVSRPELAVDGSVFYQLAGNMVIQQQVGDSARLMVPQRDVLHIRLHADRRWPYPIFGESPLLAALGDIETGSAITDQQIQFYRNQARPSAVLSTDLQLDKDQVQFLRDRWDEQARGLNQGKTPILTAGLKVQPWTVGGRDAQIAEMLKISESHIALVYRIPLPLLGLTSGSAGGTEALIQLWLASGLGFCLNHIEESFGLLFQLKGQPDEYCEFDTSALLRSLFKDRIEGLTRAVQGGVYSPNEARAEEGLEKTPYGDEPRVQQQVVPLSAAAGIPHAPGPHAPPSAAGQPAPGAPQPKPPTAETPTAVKDHRDDIRREAQRLHAVVSRIGRNRSVN